MVYAFLISSLGEAAKQSASGEVLFVSTYGQDIWDEEPLSDEPDVKTLKSLRKEQFNLVTERIQSEYEFQQRTFDIPQFQDGAFFENLPKEESIKRGIFRLQHGEVFTTDKIVVWQIRHKLAFIFILEKTESTLQAQTVLQMVVKNIDEYVKLPTQATDILQKPDKVSCILNILLPSGRLLFMNSLLIKQLERELGLFFQGK